MTRAAQRPKRKWAIAVRALAVPVWYPFAVLAWVGEKSEAVFWWIERHLPNVEKSSRAGKRGANQT